MIKNKWIRLLGALPVLWGALALSQVALLPAAHAEEFLDPEVAFKFSARALDANTLEARWQIADGYYMYRDKFRFEVVGATLGTPQRPAGKVKEDENFGKVETYRKDVRIALPIQRTPGADVGHPDSHLAGLRRCRAVLHPADRERVDQTARAGGCRRSCARCSTCRLICFRAGWPARPVGRHRHAETAAAGRGFPGRRRHAGCADGQVRLHADRPTPICTATSSPLSSNHPPT